MKQLPMSLRTDFKGNIRKGLGSGVVAKYKEEDQDFAKELARRWNTWTRLYDAFKKALVLLRLRPLTADEITAAGKEAVNAARLGSWCINQTKMGGEEIDIWHLEDVMKWVVEADLEKRIGTKEEMLKENMMLLVKHHKETCNGDCDVSLTLLMELINRAGIEVSEEERVEFFSRERK